MANNVFINSLRMSLGVYYIFHIAHCQKPTYDLGIQTYDDLSQMAIRKENINRVSLYYGTTDVRVFSTSALIDLPTFISNVGGNLGLFIGFSLLGAFFSIYDFIDALFGRANISQ